MTDIEKDIIRFIGMNGPSKFYLIGESLRQRWSRRAINDSIERLIESGELRESVYQHSVGRPGRIISM